jgi:hypothetical protein
MKTWIVSALVQDHRNVYFSFSTLDELIEKTINEELGDILINKLREVADTNKIYFTEQPQFFNYTFNVNHGLAGKVTLKVIEVNWAYVVNKYDVDVYITEEEKYIGELNGKK